MSPEEIFSLIRGLPDRSPLEGLLIILGIFVPAVFVVATGLRIYVGTRLNWRRTSRFSLYDESPFSPEARSKELGASTLTPVAGPPEDMSGQDGSEPQFHTLRTSIESDPDMARWKLFVDFVFVNRCDYLLVLHDIHAKIYLKSAAAPPLMTIGHRGEILLLADNRIRKDGHDYSLPPGDGFEITLALEMARFEGSPLYGTDHAERGPARVLFGLFVDHYLDLGDRIERRPSVPSDRLYLFQCASRGDEGSFHAIGDVEIQGAVGSAGASGDELTLARALAEVYQSHVRSRPVPKISIGPHAPPVTLS